MDSNELSDKAIKSSRRKRIFWIAIWVIGISLLVGGVWRDLTHHWTGYSNFTRQLTIDELTARQKTIWDWLELLLIPLVLAGGGLWFSWAERRNEQAIAERRTDRERELAEENAQEAALQAYLENMSALLIDKGLRQSDNAKDEVRSVARAWTLTVLRRVKGERKGLLLRFLYESDLIGQENNIVYLEGADLGETNLQATNLEQANLRRVTLWRAKMWSTSLNGANLQFANLQEADLKGALLMKANLEGANLWDANLERATLAGANLKEAMLEGANLEGANLWDANLEGATLAGANLTNAKYTPFTKWPKGFDPVKAKAVLVEIGEKLF